MSIRVTYDIYIINDEEIEDVEYFSVHLVVEDLNIEIPATAVSWVNVNITDDDLGTNIGVLWGV